MKQETVKYIEVDGTRLVLHPGEEWDICHCEKDMFGNEYWTSALYGEPTRYISVIADENEDLIKQALVFWVEQKGSELPIEQE